MIAVCGFCLHVIIALVVAACYYVRLSSLDGCSEYEMSHALTVTN